MPAKQFSTGLGTSPRKGYRPYRNRAIVYTLIETSMRRAAVTQLNIDDVDASRQTVVTTEKGGFRHRYVISKKGLNPDSPDSLVVGRLPALILPTASGG